MDKDGSMTSIAASFMLKWVTGSSDTPFYHPGRRCFNLYMLIGALCIFPLHALHVMTMLGFKVSVKELIYVVSLCVNKMAFLEGGVASFAVGV